MIRLATVDDFDPVLDMSAEFWRHTQFSEPFDRDHTEKMVSLSHDHGLLVVADDGAVYGFIAAIKSFLLASPHAQMATELAWWVNPVNRGKMTGVRLIRTLERLCIEQDVKYLNMAYMETSMPERIARMYESLGYKRQESLYTKVLYGSDHISGGGRRDSLILSESASLGS